MTAGKIIRRQIHSTHTGKQKHSHVHTYTLSYIQLNTVKEGIFTKTFSFERSL